MNFWSSDFSLIFSSLRYLNAFLAVLKTSLRIGSFIVSRSSFSFVIKVPLLLFSEAFLRIEIAVLASFLISSVKAVQASLLAFETSFFAFLSILSLLIYKVIFF